jgi:hypothetical protein
MRPVIFDLTGQTVGEWRVERYLFQERRIGNNFVSTWECTCISCGMVRSVTSGNLRRGTVRRCDCQGGKPARVIERFPREPGPHLLAHCGAWWPITAVTYPDWRCPRCRRGWLETASLVREEAT